MNKYEHHGLSIVRLKTNESVAKATPKKVIELHYEEEGEPPYIKRVCPNGCKIRITPISANNLAHESRYCPKCGQKIYSEYLDEELEITDEEWEKWNRQ